MSLIEGFPGRGGRGDVIEVSRNQEIKKSRNQEIKKSRKEERKEKTESFLRGRPVRSTEIEAQTTGDNECRKAPFESDPYDPIHQVASQEDHFRHEEEEEDALTNY